MNKKWKSLRTRLFFWYVASLFLLAIFFYVAVHIYNLRYSNPLFVFLFLILAGIGYITIYQITRSITYLSNRIKTITSRTLDERIEDIKSEDEIEELANSFNDLLQRLSDAFRREKQFIADVAHEFKTPLTIVRSDFEITLSKKRSQEEYEKVMQDAIVEIDKISTTLNNVLDLARSNIPLREHAEHFNLSLLMEELVETTHKMAAVKSIKVVDTIDPEVHISGYREKLARAFLNIIENAVKYTNAHGTITVILKKASDNALVTVQDSGVGISNEDLPQIFDRFYRSQSVEKINGSGLGLAISKAIITSHLGSVDVKSELNQGTTFTITLPIKN
jgi:signal transduction histidine kinase